MLSLSKCFRLNQTAVQQPKSFGYEAFKLSAMLQYMGKGNNMAKERLVAKLGPTKTCISRIGDNASDIRLPTLMRIAPAVGRCTRR